jgi:hypothetical protein
MPQDENKWLSYFQNQLMNNFQEVHKPNSVLFPTLEDSERVTNNHRTELDQIVAKFLATCKTRISEEDFLKKIETFISPQTSSPTAQSPQREINEMAELPEDFIFNGKFIIAAYKIFLTLNEYQNKNKNKDDEFIEENICNFSYFSQKSSHHDTLSKLLERVLNIYGVTPTRNFFRKFILYALQDVILAVQNYFWEHRFINDKRKFAPRITQEFKSEIIAIVQELRHKKPTSDFSQPKAEYSVYKEFQLVNNKLKQNHSDSTGDLLPLINFSQLQNIKRNAADGTSNESSYLTKRKGADLNSNLVE